MLERMGATVDRAAWLGAVAWLAGCLQSNPDFDHPGTSTGTTASSTASGMMSATAAASTDASGDGSSSGAPVCVPDGFEPDDDPPPLTVGTVNVVLEAVDAVDRFHVYIPAGAPGSVHASIDGASLHLCTYVRCEDGQAPTQLDCELGLSGVDGDGNPGCCGQSDAAVSFACGGNGSGKVYLVVDGAPHDCVEYDLSVSQDGG